MNSRAMTLMEVLIVVVLVGIMAAFAMANYRKMIFKANERDAVLNLTVIHGANQIYRARYASYWDTNGTVETDLINVINPTLGINITANSMAYSYVSNMSLDPNIFTAYATYTDTTGPNDFSLRVNEDFISSTNPCCESGVCPSRPACP